MFQENLRVLRKKNGLTQEELAVRLHVVRQTVSKWEKGLSVPDAELLIRMAEIFEVSVSSLLGADLNEESSPSAVADQLARINEQLAIKNRRAHRIWKTIVWVIVGFLALSLILVVLGSVAFHSVKQHSTSTIVEVQESEE